MAEPQPETVAQHRYVPAGGMSRTIAGVIKIAIGIIIKAGGWAVAESTQVELVQALTMLAGLLLDTWGVSEIYAARQSRGDITALGHRVKPVEIIVKPEAPPFLPPPGQPPSAAVPPPTLPPR